MKHDKCIDIDHPNLQPGWGCCQCNTYNGFQRMECKNCDHVRCPPEPEKKDEDDKDLKLAWN